MVYKVVIQRVATEVKAIQPLFYHYSVSALELWSNMRLLKKLYTFCFGFMQVFVLFTTVIFGVFCSVVSYLR